MFFAVVIFTVLWLLQTVFLQEFYNGMIIRNTVKVADRIASESQSSGITSYIDDIREKTLYLYSSPILTGISFTVQMNTRKVTEAD